MKVIVTGPAAASNADEQQITDPAILQTIDGLEYTEEVCATHLDEPLSEIGLSGGSLRITYDAATQTLHVLTEYLSPRKLKQAELDLLRYYTMGQWSDGIGEGGFDSYMEKTGISVSVYPIPHDDAAVQISQVDDGSQAPKRSPLLAAAKKGDVKKLQTLLMKGEPIEAKGQWELTPLLSAVCSNHAEATQYLISQGADVNFKTSEGQSCMQSASMYGNVRILTSLLEAGANIETRDDRGATPLMWAANRSHPDAVKLLVESGANVNAQDLSGRTVLMYTAPECLDILEYLLKQGADPKIKSAEGRTAAEESMYQAECERKRSWSPPEQAEFHEKKAKFLSQNER